MAPRTVYPRSNTEIVNLLETLGFKRKRGIGRGKHPEKYVHPSLANLRVGDKPFVLVTHEYIAANGQRLMKKLQNWGFTEYEIKQACKGIAPSKKPVVVENDTEPEGA